MLNFAPSNHQPFYMKSVIQFAHANGFPAKTYTEFFRHLAPFEVQYIPVMGHGKYGFTPDWKPLGKELIEYILENHRQPVIGIGHSLGGGALMYAAHWRPDLFERIIFLDPPLFPIQKHMGFKILKTFGLLDRVGPSGRAKNRKANFENHEAAFDYFRNKLLFKNFDKKCFEDYIKHGLKPSKNGELELVFGVEKEYEAFRNTAFIRGKIRYEMPSYFVYSSEYTVLNKKDLKTLQNKFTNTEFIKFEGGHLFPLEQPENTSSLIKSLILKK